MKKRTIQIAGFLSVALLSVMTALSGCGSSEKSTSAPASEEPKKAEQTEEKGVEVEKIVREDLTICMPGDLETFDPIATSAVNSQAIHRLMYIRLYDEDTKDQPVEWLIKNFTVVSDTEIDISICDGFTFSDGSPITAEDVVYTLERAHESSYFSTLMASVDHFETVDATNFKIITTGPSPSIKIALMHPGTCILPKSYIEQAEASGDWSNPVCSGPYKLGERSVGEYTKLVARDDYIDTATSAKNKSIMFKNVPEAASRTIMVETGEADLAYNFSTADYDRCAGNPELAIHSNSGMSIYYIGFDTTKAPFDNVLVRQAVSYAINRQDVVDAVIDGYGQPLYCVLPPATLGYVENPGNYSYDVDKARELMEQAGYKDGASTKMLAFDETAKNIAEIAQGFLADIGIQVEIEVYDSSVRSAMTANHQVPMFAGRWGAMADADLVLPRLFTKAAIGSMNQTFYTNPEVEELLVQARSTYETDERRPLYEQAVTILAEDAPWCPLYAPEVFALSRADLQGVELSASPINLWNLHY